MIVKRCLVPFQILRAVLKKGGRIILALSIGLLLTYPASAQKVNNSTISSNSTAKIAPNKAESFIGLSDKDVEETIRTYRSVNASESLKNFLVKMPPAVTDSKIREEILRKLPAVIQQLKIEDDKAVQFFHNLIAPVLKLYGRENAYNIVIFRHSTPMMFSDTGVVIVISSGMIERAESDDELLGFVAHEVGHEYFAKYSIYSKYLLKLIDEGDGEIALKNKLSGMLALIELQCDSFAALTLANLNYQPLAFIEAMERTTRDFPNHGTGFHPPDAIRRSVVSKVAPERSLVVNVRQSLNLQKLKRLLNTRSSQSHLDKKLPASFDVKQKTLLPFSTLF
jgi:hypothetical protein